jgi:CheY-like chemotaxis protein
MTPSPCLRILLVEDNPVNQRVARALLARKGHSVVVAANGREALDAVAAEPAFDLVLMDLQMPEMDGLEATAAIRAGEEGTGRRLPIVALTALADRERCLAAGMDAYLSKPVQPHQLFRTLTEVAGRTAADA